MEAARVLATYISKRLLGPNGTACYERALEEGKRVSLEGQAIRKPSLIALVSIADDKLLGRRTLGHGLPLGASREGRPAAATQPRLNKAVNDLIRCAC